MPKVLLSAEKKQEIVLATYEIIKKRTGLEFPNDPRHIYEHYVRMDEQQKNGFWNEVQFYTGIEHQQAYKYFINSWTRKAFDSSVQDNKQDFVNYIVAYFMKYQRSANVCAAVWSQLKQIVLQNQWHQSQSYAMSHHNLIRLLRTSAEIDILSFLTYQSHEQQL